jgi:hypothetical protein
MENEPKDKAIKKMVSFQKSFKLRKFWLEMNSLGIAKSAWEKGDRSNFEILLKQEQLMQKVIVPYVPIWHGSNKPTRISGLQPPLCQWDSPVLGHLVPGLSSPGQSTQPFSHGPR